jgi:hypothetical protein
MQFWFKLFMLFSHTMCNEFVKKFLLLIFGCRRCGITVLVCADGWGSPGHVRADMYLPTKASRKTLYPFLLVVSSGGICLMCMHDSMSVDLAGLFLPTTVSMLCYSELSVTCHYCFYTFRAVICAPLHNFIYCWSTLLYVLLEHFIF